MKTRKNVKGFTLVELIVVIAIIGVLAAILVPSMLGYVKKSKVSAANSDAKNLYDAVNTACVELDSEGETVADLDGAISGWGGAERVANYFDYTALTKAEAKVTGAACLGAYVETGTYHGGYPNAAPNGDENANFGLADASADK